MGPLRDRVRVSRWRAGGEHVPAPSALHGPPKAPGAAAGLATQTLDTQLSGAPSLSTHPPLAVQPQSRLPASQSVGVQKPSSQPSPSEQSASLAHRQPGAQLSTGGLARFSLQLVNVKPTAKQAAVTAGTSVICPTAPSGLMSCLCDTGGESSVFYQSEVAPVCFGQMQNHVTTEASRLQTLPRLPRHTPPRNAQRHDRRSASTDAIPRDRG